MTAPINNYSEQIQQAWSDFKGGYGDNIPEKREMIDVVETARTNRTRYEERNVECVRVYLSKGQEEIPSIVEQAAEDNDLVNVGVEERYDGSGIKQVIYIPEKYA